MRRKFLLISILLIWTAVAHSKPGFHDLSDNIIPKAVKVASGGVLRIKFPLLPPFDPKSEQGSAILQSLTDAISSYDDVERGLMEPQVKKCKDNIDDFCTIYDRGTAFLVDDTKTLCG